MSRAEELKEIFKDVDESQRKLIQPLIDEVIFLEVQMQNLKKLPFISTNPKNPNQQRKTEAAKLYKECSQSYMNAIRILCSLLHKGDGGEEDPVAKFMESF
ncbi:MAG: hypothetical protein MJ245_00290 [Clostridia bacterium]|nr:hypothetical protein [Clostridia bacterium]